MAYRNWKQELNDPRAAPASRWPFIFGTLGVFAVMAALSCLALWIWPGYLVVKPWRRPGPPPKRLSVFFSSDVHGHLEPCECTAQRWGGIARISGLLNSVDSSKTRLAFDVGQMTGGNLLWQRLVWTQYLHGLGRMNFTAANLGASEITLTSEQIRRAAETSPVPLVSANVIDKTTGRPLIRTHHQVLVDNLRVTVVGVVQAGPEDQRGQGIDIADPQQTLATLLPRLRRDTDLLVLLAWCDQNMIRDIARAHPEIDLILGGQVQQASLRIEQIGTRWIAYHANKGQILGRVDLSIGNDARPESATSQMILLDNDVPQDPDMLELIEQYNAELARLNREGGLVALGVTLGEPRPGTNAYQGSKSCQSCHGEIYSKWMKSEHSRAYASLVKSKRQSNPDCIRCHVLGMGSSDGFQGMAITPALIDVHCESCHGRAGDHVRARQRSMDKAVGRLQPVLPNSCQSCHDRIHSPTFSYNSYWEKIKHGN